MKNLSIILNVILVVAVGYLYYLHFTSSTSAIATVSDKSNTSKVILPDIQPKDIKSYPIVYVNGDSLLSNYDFVKDVQKDLGGRKSRLEATYKSRVENFQQKYNDLQQKAQSGQMTAEQAGAEERKLENEKASIGQLQSQMDLLMDETSEKNTVMQKKVADFLKRYNKNGQYKYVLTYNPSVGLVLFADQSLDVTSEVIDGLNAEYKLENHSKK